MTNLFIDRKVKAIDRLVTENRRLAGEAYEQGDGKALNRLNFQWADLEHEKEWLTGRQFIPDRVGR